MTQDVAAARVAEMAAWCERGDTGAEGSILLSASVADEHASDLRSLLARIAALEEGMRPVTMQDVRLRVGEGKLSAVDVLAGVNAELRVRMSLANPQDERGRE